MKHKFFIRQTIWAGEPLAQKIFLLFLGYALGIFPLLGGPYAQITQSKTLLILIPALFILALMLILGWRPDFSACGKVGICLLIFCVWALTAALFSPYGTAAFVGAGRSGGWLGLCFCLLLWLAGASWGGGRRRLLLTAMAGGLLVMNAVGLCQLFGLNPLGLYPSGLNYWDGDVRYAGTFLTTIGNTGQLGAFYCLSLPFLLFSFSREKSFLRWLWLLSVGSGLVIVCWAGLDAAILALGLGLPLSVALSSKTLKHRLLLGGGFLLFLALALWGIVHYQGDNLTLREAAALLRGEWIPSFGSYRLGVWRNTWLMIRERPWLGWGPDCFRLAYGEHYPGGALWDAAHCEYLGYWCDLGLPGLLAYGTAFLFSCLGAFRQKDRAGGAMLLCYGIQACFSFPTFLIAPLFWLLWGVVWGETKKKQENPLVLE